MPSVTGASSASPAASPERSAADMTRVLVRLAVAGIAGSILIMIVVSLARDSWMYPPMAGTGAAPPWGLRSLHVSAGVATVALWVAVLAGAGGVVAGLLAVQRGARPSVRALLIAAALAVAALAVLPPAGSTDVFDYAAYGRIMTLGHNPYLMSPYRLRLAHNAFAQSVPVTWEHVVSVYGPLATFEQFLAAKLGGISAARIVFWLKLWDAIAFGLVAFVLDRLLRGDPARRLRAHLLWTVNPLLLWSIVAGGHLDVLAAAAGLAGLLMLGEQSDGARPGLARVLAAGALIGIAADIKINYALFGLGLAWALRRSPTRLAAASAAAIVVAVPGYAYFGWHAVQALADRRGMISADTFYHLFLIDTHWRSHLTLVAALLVTAVALLALRRMPAAVSARPAIRPALALSAAWLFFWPYQLPWYDVMIICLLVIYPASRLDWLVLARLVVGTLANVPGNPPTIMVARTSHTVIVIHNVIVYALAPLTLLGAAAGLVMLCLTGRWRLAEPGAAAGAVPHGAAGVDSTGPGPADDRVSATDRALPGRPAA
jgi:hypothetical protein